MASGVPRTQIDLNTPAVGGSGGIGDVVGPSSATDNAIARFDGVTGKLIQNSTTALSDAGVITAAGFAASGAAPLTFSPFANYGMGVGAGTLQFNTGGGYDFQDGTAAPGFGLNAFTTVFYTKKGADVASASAIVPTGNLFHVTGTTDITSINATNVPAGAEITIIFDGILTFTNGNNLKLAGNFVTSALDTITLKFDGTNFYEICRSVNT